MIRLCYTEKTMFVISADEIWMMVFCLHEWNELFWSVSLCIILFAAILTIPVKTACVNIV